MHPSQLLMRRLLRYPKIPLFLAFIWVPKEASPLIFANLNPHILKMLPKKIVEIS